MRRWGTLSPLSSRSGLRSCRRSHIAGNVMRNPSDGLDDCPVADGVGHDDEIFAGVQRRPPGANSIPPNPGEQPRPVPPVPCSISTAGFLGVADGEVMHLHLRQDPSRREAEILDRPGFRLGFGEAGRGPFRPSPRMSSPPGTVRAGPSAILRFFDALPPSAA